MYNGIYHIERFAYFHDVQERWLKKKIVFHESLATVLQNKGIQKIAIYGLGEYGKLAYEDIRSGDIQTIAFIDKKLGGKGNCWRNIPIIGLDDVGQMDKGIFILVTLEFWFVDIVEDLKKCGVSLERIISLAMLV